MNYIHWALKKARDSKESKKPTDPEVSERTGIESAA
jgi:hypothetical protein